MNYEIPNTTPEVQSRNRSVAGVSWDWKGRNSLCFTYDLIEMDTRHKSKKNEHLQQRLLLSSYTINLANKLEASVLLVGFSWSEFGVSRYSFGLLSSCL